MVYIVNYDIKDTDRKANFLSEAKKIGDTLQFLPHALFVSSLDINTNQGAIYNQLKQVTNDDDLFIVSQAPLSQMSGWLTSSAVDWLKTHNQ